MLDAAGEPSQPPDAGGDGSGDYDWLFDPEAWVPVPELNEAGLAIANVTKLQWPGFVWEPCGVGCRMSRFDPGPIDITASASVTLRSIGGHWIGSFTLGYPLASGSWARLLLRVDLDTGEPWGAVRLESVAAVDMATMLSDAARLFVLVPLVPSGQDGTIGLLPGYLGDSVRWTSPKVPTGSTYRGFDFDGTWHWGTVIDHHAVKVATQEGSTVLELVHSGSYIQEMAVGGTSLYWTDCESPNARLWGWTLGGQAKVFASGPWNAAIVAASDERIAWVATQGTQYCSGSYESADLFWSPRVDDPAQMQIHGPIPLPLRFLSPSAVSNSWAALLQYHEEGAGILIVRLADGKKWEIPPRLPKHVSYVAGVRDNEVIASEWTSTTVLQPSRILRYDLTQLEQFAIPLP